MWEKKIVGEWEGGREQECGIKKGLNFVYGGGLNFLRILEPYLNMFYSRHRFVHRSCLETLPRTSK